MNADEHRAALRYWTLTTTLYNDPDLTGDLQTLALALARQLAQHGRAQLATAMTDLGWARYRIIDTIRSDIPRHEPTPGTGRCPAPQPTAGDDHDLLCGRPALFALTAIDIDPDTGHQLHVGFCSRHGTLQHEIRRHWHQWHANHEPSPSPNSGGILTRHFRTANWPDVYQRASTGQLLRTPLEPEPTHHPALTLIHGTTR